MTTGQQQKHNSGSRGRLRGKVAMAGGLLVLAVAMLILKIFPDNPLHPISEYLSGETDEVVFGLLMALLPLVGVPITIFLVLVGMVYGLAGGILLTGVLMLFHQITTYYLVHSLFRPLVVRLLQRIDLEVPHLVDQGKMRVGIVFMLLPGLPYTVKNYLFALTGMPLRPYLLISWTTQFSLSIPFVILGKGVIKLDPLILVLATLVILLGLAGQQYLRRRYSAD